jgi:hypothetical protein
VLPDLIFYLLEIVNAGLHQYNIPKSSIKIFFLLPPEGANVPLQTELVYEFLAELVRAIGSIVP